MNNSHSTSTLIDRFLESFNSGDLGAMRSALADDAVAFVTGPDGNPVRLDGAEMYIAALGAMDLTNVDYSVELTQAPMLIGDDQALIMTEVRARRGDKTLQNFAAHLLRVADGKIVEMCMVDAKPAESGAFWAWSPLPSPAGPGAAVKIERRTASPDGLSRLVSVRFIDKPTASQRR